MGDERWREVAPGVLVRRYDTLDLNIGLVLGDEQCLVVDTRCDAREGAELAASIREITPLPWQIVNTHAHFDHYYGNAAFMPAPVWAQSGFLRYAADQGGDYRAQVVEGLRELGEGALADGVERTELVLPDRLVVDRAVIDLGGRDVHLMYAGRGHTDHDLVVAVRDAQTAFWGDLIESSNDPSFDDSFPREWGMTVSRLLDTVEIGLASVMVPGHGPPIRRDSVEAQCDQLQRLAWFLGEGLGAGEREVEPLIERTRSTGFTEDTLRAAAERALLD